MSVFDFYAAYYDLLYRDKDYVGEAAYIARLISAGEKPQGSVLEIGCGTGHHACLLTEAGYSVLGVDLSESMLARAQRRKQLLGVSSRERLNFAQGDARSFRSGKKFDAVISLFHVISYQNSNLDVAAQIRTANVHLSVGGRFIFDFWYAPAVLTQVPEVREKKLEDAEIEVCRLARPEHLPNQNVVKVNYQVNVREKTSGQSKLIEECHSMRYFSLPEMTYFLEQGGFKVTSNEEWLTSRELGVDTWGACIIAQKIREA